MQLAYAPALASIPWYTAYTPAEAENRMNLRKRKPLAILPSTTNGASGDETVDEEETVTPPPRKRARTRKSAASRSAESRAKSSVNDDRVGEDARQGDGTRAPETAEAALLLAPDVAPTLTKSAKRERIDSPIVIFTADDSAQPGQLDVEEAPELRKSLRQRERKAKAASSASPASVTSTLTPTVRARGLSQAPSRESSSATPESLEGGESGSSTAVSLCEEEATKSKATDIVEEVVDDNEAEEDGVESPVTKKPRISRPRARGGSRARSATKNKTDTVTDETKTNATVQARPKARSRAKTRRR